MKRKEIYEVDKRLSSVKQSGKTFTLVIADNKRKIAAIISDMEKQIEPTIAFKKYLKDVEELKRRFAEKDHIGRPKMKPGNYPDGNRGMFYTIPGSEDPESEFRKKLAELEIANKDAIIEHDERERRYWDEFLEEEMTEEIIFRRIRYSEIPKDITQPEMDAIMDFIDDLPENPGSHERK